MFPGTPYVTALLLITLFFVVIGCYAWRHRDEAGADWFMVLSFSLVVWTLVCTIGIVSPTDRLRVLTWSLEFSLGGWLTIPWFCFALSYTGYGRLLTTRRLLALTVVPAINTVVITTNLGGLAWSDAVVSTIDGVATVDFTIGSWLLFHYGYTYLVLLAGLGVIVRCFVVDRWFERGQGIALIVGAVVPLVTEIAVMMTPLSTLPVTLTPFVLAVSAAAFGYALFNHRLLSAVPGTQRLGEVAAVDAIDEGVIVLNARGEVVSTNPVVRSIVGEEVSSIHGAAFETLFDEVAGLEELPTTVSPDGRRTYQVSTSSIDGSMGEPIGHTVLFKDVTAIERHRQRLQVVHRLLRHNIRNDMNVVQGYATMLRENGSNEAAIIEETATGLLELATKMRQAEGLLQDDAGTVYRIDCGELVAGTVAAARESYPETSFSLEIDRDDDLVLDTDPDALEFVVAELLENASVHTDGSETPVTVRVERECDSVEIAVADTGPGISEEELRAITEGEETPLEHTSGIGLWLCTWGVHRLGGDLRFGENAPRGTVVEIRLPLEQDSELSPPDPGGRTANAIGR